LLPYLLPQKYVYHAIAVSSSSTVPAFNHHVTVYIYQIMKEITFYEELSQVDLPC
jgi:hypothetical protein